MIFSSIPSRFRFIVFLLLSDVINLELGQGLSFLRLLLAVYIKKMPSRDIAVATEHPCS
jgi:hypothetical protein